jgi:hypothetical protein
MEFEQRVTIQGLRFHAMKLPEIVIKLKEKYIQDSSNEP